MNNPGTIRPQSGTNPSPPRGRPALPRKTLWAVFAAPALIAVISTVGLVVALTGDGLRNIISWVALGIPVIVAIRAWTRRG